MNTYSPALTLTDGKTIIRAVSRENLSSVCAAMSDTNKDAKLQKLVKRVNFRIHKKLDRQLYHMG